LNIKAAEERSGVSRQNIRFYEREGLLTPDRNPENDYREYGEAHVDILKRIRVMRMVDMPLDQIKRVLEGTLSPAQAAQAQKIKLKQQQEQLAAAIRFCEEWTEIQTLDAMDSDRMLARMEAPENKESLFHQWQEDYRKVVLSEREKVFTLVPETPVTTAREFTDALFAYANANNLDLVITKESMYPEFTINGIEYTAERFYSSMSRLPVASIRCSVKYPEDFEPDVPPTRKKLIKLLRMSWLLIPFVLLTAAIMFRFKGAFRSWEVWAAILGFSILIGANMYRSWLLYYNHKQ
jgi:DNA-binding transcriptional MerR regulator